MELRVWRSFSCNNSSSYYLVATFESPDRAAEVGKIATDFLTTYAREKDAILDEGLDDWEAAMAEETQVEKDVAAAYGFAWPGETIFWGESELVGDEPIVSTVEDKVFVYHGYCAGGLEFLDPLLAACGGTDMRGDMDSPLLNVILAFSDDEHGATAREVLAQFFSQRGSTEYMDQWSGAAFGVSNPRHTDDDDLLVWQGIGHGGFSMRVDDETLAGIRKMASGPGIDDVWMTLEDEGLRNKLRTLIAARDCRECKSPLRYIPADDSMSEDQLACAECGGMFALGTVTAD